LTAITVAALFLLSLLFAPIFLAIPAFATAPALIFVGYLMISSLKNVDFDDFCEAVPAFSATIAMPFAYSISEGISWGIISYVAINMFVGGKKINPILYILAILFLAKYILV